MQECIKPCGMKISRCGDVSFVSSEMESCYGVLSILVEQGSIFSKDSQTLQELESMQAAIKANARQQILRYSFFKN